ncbi:MAG: hypothetical protein IK020_05520 [Clostridiales bacterium]|nr:hypothetical protein [Clostridiales bacterium]
MKKIIAILLSMSMVLALAGCSKEEETTKKPKKTKETTEEEDTSDTEEPDTSDTEDPDTSGTTEESDTSDTEPSDTNVAVPGGFTVSHTLEDLGFYNVPTDLAFARPYVDGDNTTMMAVAEYCDDYYFDTPGYDGLSESIDDFYGYLLASCDSLYDTSRSKFILDIADGNYHMSVCRICQTTVFRADSEVCSLLVTSMTSEEGEGTAPFLLNYRSKTGEAINFDDVVTDRAAFCDFVDSYLIASPELLDGYKEDISLVLDMIRGGYDIYFTLGFDGIFISIESDKYFKVPVYMLDNCVNMEFFGNTPESYTLVADDTRAIDWDIDGDGLLDKIKLDMTYDEYDAVNTMTLWYNNEKASVPSEMISDVPIYFDTFYFMHVHGADYVYIVYYEESAGSSGYCFELDDTGVSFVCQFEGTFQGFPYNPESFDFGFSSEIMGTSTITGNYTINLDGQPVPDNTFFRKLFYGASRSAVTKADIEGALKLDEDLNVVDTITIPAGTTLYTYVIDFDTMYIIYSTVEEDPDQEFLVAVPFELPADSYEVLINGMPQQELFAGLQFAG